MVTALVLLNIECQQIKGVSEKLVNMKEVSEVYSVAGRYDLVAVVRVKTNEQIADTIAGKFGEIGHGLVATCAPVIALCAAGGQTRKDAIGIVFPLECAVDAAGIRAAKVLAVDRRQRRAQRRIRMYGLL